jgi:hypothetical protein
MIVRELCNKLLRLKERISKTFPVHEQGAANSLFKKLLDLYPGGFRERLGESMKQTFSDLYKERQAEGKGPGFVLWTFTETGIGIFREYVLLITEGAMMKTMLVNPRLAPVVSFIFFVLPFMILEWATRSNAPRSDASPMLWVVLWFLSTGFMLVLMLVVQSLRTGNTILANPVSLFLRFIFFAVLAWMWVALVIDQMPCFLGGGGC